MSDYLNLAFRLLQAASLVVFFATALALAKRWLEPYDAKLPPWARHGGGTLVTGLVLGAVGVLTYHIPVVIGGLKLSFGPVVVICSTLVGGLASGAITGTIVWLSRVVDLGTLTPFSGFGLLASWACAGLVLQHHRRRGAKPGMGAVLVASAVTGVLLLVILSLPGSPFPLDVVWWFVPLWSALMTATAALFCGTLFYFERERALQTVLAASEARYALLMDASHAGLFDRNMVTGEIWRSERAQQITGGADGSTYQDLVARVHPEDLKEFEDNLARAVARRASFTSRRYRLKMPDGAWRWIDSELRLVYADDGTLARLVGSNADVTDQIQAEQASKASEARFSNAFRNSPYPMLITRFSDGTHVAANAAATAMLGWSLDELIGRTTMDLDIWVDPRDRDHIRETVSRDGVLNAYAVQIRIKGGSVRDILLTASLTETGDEPCMLSIVRDVTDSLGAARRLAEVNAERDAHLRRLRDITDNLPVLIAYSDTERRLQFVNRIGERWLQRPINDIIGRHRDELLPDFPRTPPEVITRVLAGEALRVERRGLYPDGITRDVEMHYVPDRDEAGRTRGYYTLTTDITERKAKDAQLLQAQKIEALGRLAGGIAHDFNNMIGTIIGFNSFLLQDLPPTSPEHKFAVRIGKICEHAKQVVNQILDFARSTPTERERVDLEIAVEADLGLIDGVLPPSTRLSLKTSGDALPVMVDKGQFYQALLNLCKNASDAMGGAPGTVTIELSRLAPGTADFGDRAAGSQGGGVASITNGRLDPDKPYALIRVSDDGCGMDQSTLERAFEPFFTTKRRGVGTGLGLAVLHGIVSSSGGAYRVTSRLGAGSVFSIYLPIAAASVRPTDAPAADRRGFENVLVIDDDVTAGEVLTIGLERLGYTVTRYHNPLDALSAFETSPGTWQAVITDETMPEMAGRTLAAHLKAVRPECPIILYTGLGVEAIGDDRTSVDAVMGKPSHPGLVAAVLRRLLERRGARVG